MIDLTPAGHFRPVTKAPTKVTLASKNFYRLETHTFNTLTFPSIEPEENLRICEIPTGPTAHTAPVFSMLRFVFRL